METAFPSLLTFSFLAPTLLRIVVAIAFAHDIKHFRHAARKNQFLGAIAGILAVLLFIGASMQIDAVVGVLYMGYVWYAKLETSVFMKRETAYLALAILLSLLVLGAGAFAVDLPY